MKRLLSVLFLMTVLLPLTGCLTLKPFTQEELERISPGEYSLTQSAADLP